MQPDLHHVSAATPERSDGGDLLAPFHYFGVPDDGDYTRPPGERSDFACHSATRTSWRTSSTAAASEPCPRTPDRQIREARRKASQAGSLEAKLAGQKQIKALEAQRTGKRRTLFDAQTR
jgi:hypothetical protein